MNIIIVGEGKEVHFLIKSFISKGHHVTLIINNKEICRRFSKEHEEIEVVYGDATKPTILEDAGAVYANIVIALTQHDPDNLIICQMAKELYGVARTFAIVNDPKNVEIFKKL
ncbi:MAG: NAD-binding protein, partial [Fusobacterium mortiferum]|nr:NAD-binding protein [Fusobacterium mortiferum]